MESTHCLNGMILCNDRLYYPIMYCRNMHVAEMLGVGNTYNTTGRSFEDRSIGRFNVVLLKCDSHSSANAMVVLMDCHSAMDLCGR